MPSLGVVAQMMMIIRKYNIALIKSLSAAGEDETLPPPSRDFGFLLSPGGKIQPTRASAGRTTFDFLQSVWELGSTDQGSRSNERKFVFAKIGHARKIWPELPP